MYFVFELDPCQDLRFGFLRGVVDKEKHFVPFIEPNIQLSMALEYRQPCPDDPMRVVQYSCISIDGARLTGLKPDYAIASLDGNNLGNDLGWSVMSRHIFDMLKTIIDTEPAKIIDAPWPLWYFLLDDRFNGYCQEIYVTVGDKKKGDVLAEWYRQKLYIQNKRVLAEIERNNRRITSALEL